MKTQVILAQIQVFHQVKTPTNQLGKQYLIRLII